MTLYAGETIQIRHRATGYNGENLTNVQVDVTVTVWDLDRVVLVDEASMTYSATLAFEDGAVGGWYYLWLTPVDPGAYLSRVTVTGVNISAWEFKTLRLRRNKNEAVV